MEPWVVPIFLVFFLTQVSVETALLVVNLRHASRARGVPVPLEGAIEAGHAERSRAYTLTNGNLGLVEGLAGAVLTLAALFSGVLPWLDRWLASHGVEGAHQFVAYLALLSLASSAVMLPFGAYRTFVVETRFGFNRTTPRTWLADRLKSLLVQAALGIPLLYAVYGFMRFTG